MLSGSDWEQVKDLFGETEQESASNLQGYNQLKRVYLNELYAPELREYQDEIIESFRSKIELQVFYHDKTNNVQDFVIERPEDTIRLFAIQQEIERIKFIIQSYLKARLDKV